MYKIVNIQVVVMFKQLLSPNHDYFDTSGKVRKTFKAFRTISPQFIPGDTSVMPPEIPRFVFQVPTNGDSVQMTQQSIAFSNSCNISTETDLFYKLEDIVTAISTFIFELDLSVTVRFGIVLNGVKSKENMLNTLSSIITPEKYENFTTEESEIAFLKKYQFDDICLNRWTRFSFNNNIPEQLFLFDFNTDQTNSLTIENVSTLKNIYLDKFATPIREAFNEQ